MGFIRTNNPQLIRNSLSNLRYEIKNDTYLAQIPSVKKSIISFHAKDDCPEVREKVYKLLLSLDFKAEFIVARKNINIFNTRHKGKQSIFYDDLFSKLFENKLHLANSNKIYYAVRGNRDRQEPITEAVQAAILAFESKWKIKNDSSIEVYPQSPIGEPCLQVADYMNWAVQRGFERREDRYLNFVGEKISYLVDLYDFKNYPNNFYNKRSIFKIEKISPL